MTSMKLWIGLAIFAASTPAWGAAAAELTGSAAKLYQQAKSTSRFFAEAERLQPEIRPTSDGRSYFVIWKAAPRPKHWIVSLHGAGRPAKGFATDDLVVWQRHLKDSQLGLICLQWWLGTGDRAADFLTPQDVYREVDRLLTDLNVQPGSVMLHGFSRGSTNTFAVAALDAGRGKHYFSLNVASSGGVALDYPPTRALVNGEFGERPLAGTRWVTVAGERDVNPERDGIAGMRKTAAWLKDQGATVVAAIEDPGSGHGALHLNPKNCQRVLELFSQSTRR